MADEIKILNGRKYQKKGDQWFDIGPADAMEKIVSGKKYVQKDGQWFESPEQSVKKKDGGIGSGLAGVGGQSISKTEESATALSTGVGSSDNPPANSKGAAPKKYIDDIFAKGGEITPISGDADAPEIQETDKYVVVSVEGRRMKVSPNYLPEGYDKTKDGARKYAEDVSTGILKSRLAKNVDSFQSYIKDLEKTSEFSSLDDSPSTFTEVDKNKIVSETGITGDTNEELLQKLRNEKTRLSLRETLFPKSKDPVIQENRKKADNIQSYIDKISSSMQEEVKADDLKIGIMAGDTKSPLRSAFQNPVKQVVERMSVENMTDELATGVESLKYSDPEKYKILKRRMSEGKTISSIEAAQLTSKGADIIKARSLEKMYRGEIDLDAYAEKMAKVSEVKYNNLYKRPDVLQKYLSDVIAKYYQGSNPVYGQHHISDNEIDSVPAEEFAKMGIDVSKPEVQAGIKNIKVNEGALPFDNAIQKDSWARETWRGFAQPLKGSINTLSNIGVGDDARRLQSELEGVNVSDYVAQRSEWFNKRYGGIADAFNGAGQFVGQYLLMEAGVGLFKGAGALAGGSNAMKILKTPEAAEASLVRSGGTKVGNYLIDKSQLMSSLSVPFIQSYDQYYKDALTKTDDPWAARGVAFINAGMEALSERMFNNIKFGRQVVYNLRTGASMDEIAEIFKKGITEESADQLKNVIQKGLKKSIQIVGKGATDLVSEAVEEIPVSAANFLTDAMLNPSLVQDRNIFEEMKDSFMAGLVSFSIPSIIGTGARFKKQFSNPVTQNDALMIAAKNRSSVLDAIYSQLEDGYIDQEEANSRIQVLNTASSTLRELPKNYAVGSRMSEEDKVNYLSLSVKEKYLKEQNGKLEEGDPVLMANKQSIQAIQEAKKDILFKGSGVYKTPEEVILTEAKSKRLAGGYSELLSENPQMVSDVMLDYAKQMHGVSDDGSDLDGGGRELTNENVALAVTRKYPTKQSVIDVIKPLRSPVATAETVSEPVVEANEPEIVPDPDNGIVVSEMIDKPGKFRGMKGRFYVDEEEVVFKEEGKPKEYVLGRVKDVSDRTIDDFGIEHETSVVEADEDGAILVRGQKYVNNYSDPMMAVNETKKGYTVTLETPEGKKRTFRGSIGEDIAYQINLQQITKNNEQKSFEEFVSSDPEAIQSVQDGGYTEVAQEDAAQTDAAIPAKVEREVIEPKDEQTREEVAEVEEQAAAEVEVVNTEAEAEKIQALKESTKPNLSLPFAESSQLIGKMGKARMKNVNEQQKVDDQFQKLIDLIDCIYG